MFMHSFKSGFAGEGMNFFCKAGMKKRPRPKDSLGQRRDKNLCGATRIDAFKQCARSLSRACQHTLP